MTYAKRIYYAWTKREKINCILQELDQIKKHFIKGHVILVDYIYYGNIPLELIKEKLLQININYKFKLEKGGHLGQEENSILAAYL